MKPRNTRVGHLTCNDQWSHCRAC